MIYKTFLLALGEDVETSLQNPNNKRRRRPPDTITNKKGRNFTEEKRRDSEVLGTVESSCCETAPNVRVNSLSRRLYNGDFENKHPNLEPENECGVTDHNFLTSISLVSEPQLADGR